MSFAQNNNTNTNNTNATENDEQVAVGYILGTMLDRETAAVNAAAMEAKAEADNAAKAAALAKAEAPPKLGRRAERAEHRGIIHKLFSVKRMRTLNPAAANALKKVRVQKQIEPQPERKDVPKRGAKEQATEKIKRNIIDNPLGMHNINEGGQGYHGYLFAGDGINDRLLLHFPGDKKLVKQCRGKELYTKPDDEESLYLWLELSMDKKDVEAFKKLARTLDELKGVKVVGFNVKADSLRITNGDAVQARAARATPATLAPTTPMQDINALQRMCADGPELLLAIEMKGLGDQEEVQKADGSVSIKTFLPAKPPTDLDGVSGLVVPVQGLPAAPGKKKKNGYQLILAVEYNKDGSCKPGLVLSTDNLVFYGKTEAPERMPTSQITLPGESSDDESPDSESENEAGKKVPGKKRKEKYESDSSWQSSSGKSAEFSSEGEEELEYNQDAGETLSPQQMEKAIADAKKLLEKIEKCYEQPSALPQRGELVRLLQSTQLAQIKSLFKPNLVLKTLDACAKKTNARQTEPTSRCPARVALWYNEMKTKKGTQQKKETQRKTTRLGEMPSKKPRLDFGKK
jgi:hypothetical protein